MSCKTRFTFRVPENIGEALRSYCESEDLYPSQVMRRGLRQVIPDKFFVKDSTGKRRRK